MTERDPSQRVVITGYDCITSVGQNLQETYEAMMNGQRGVANERDWLLEQCPAAYHSRLRSHLAGRAKEFNLFNEPGYADRIDNRFVERYLTRSAELAWKAAAGALRHAGVVTEMLEIGAVEPERLALVIGTGIGGAIEVGKYRSLLEAGQSIPATGMSRAQPENAVVTLAQFYKAKGPSSTVTGACAASNMAIADAVRKLERGEADIILTGGTEGLDFQIIAQFERTKAANLEEDPASASRPFDHKPGQAVLSEGSGLLVLETEEHAKRRGAKIYGVLAGFGETNDAFDPTLLSGEGIVRAMKMALSEAGVSGEERLIHSAHATATSLGDEAERDAIREVFNGQDYHPEQIAGSVISTKGFTGHPVGAANGVEAVVFTHALNEGKVFPAPWIEEPLDGMAEFTPPPNHPTDTEATALISNGMGFGGQNSVIVVKKYEGTI